MDSIAVIDFGSQYAQLIVRRVREARVYCEMFPWDAAPEVVLASDPKGFILSGGPASVYADGAPQIQDFILASELPSLPLLILPCCQVSLFLPGCHMATG